MVEYRRISFSTIAHQDDGEVPSFTSGFNALVKIIDGNKWYQFSFTSLLSYSENVLYYHDITFPGQNRQLYPGANENLIGSIYSAVIRVPDKPNGSDTIGFYWKAHNNTDAIFQAVINSSGDLFVVNGGAGPQLVLSGLFADPAEEHQIGFIVVDVDKYILVVDNGFYDDSGIPFVNAAGRLFPYIGTFVAYHNTPSTLPRQMLVRDVFHLQPNNGLQLLQFEEIEDFPPGLTFLEDHPVMSMSGNNRHLIVVDDTGTRKLFRFDYLTPGTWTEITSITPINQYDIKFGSFYNTGTYPSLIDISVIYHHYDSGTNKSKIRWTIDNGATWLALPDMDGRIIGLAVDKLGITPFLHVIAAANSPSTNQLIVKRMNLSTSSYDRSQTVNLPFTVTWSNPYPMPALAFWDRVDNWIVAVNDTTINKAIIFVINELSGALSNRYTFGTGEVVPDNPNRYKGTFDYNSDGNNFILITLEDGSGGHKTFLGKDTSFQNLWSDWSEITDEPLQLIENDEFNTRSEANRYWAIKESATDMFGNYWNRMVNHLIRTLDPPTGVTGRISCFGIMATSDEKLYWAHPISDDTVKACQITAQIAGKPTSVDMIMEPTSQSPLLDGRFLEFYDGINGLAFIGKIVTPNDPSQRSMVQYELVGLDYDMFKKPRTQIDGSTNTRSFLQTFVNQLDFVYQDGSIDPSNDFSLSYQRQINESLSKFSEFARHLERAIFGCEPDGKVFCYKYSRITTATQEYLYWGSWYNSNPDLILLSFQQPDMRITRADVSGGSNSDGQVRVVYVGDQAAEDGSEGVNAIQKNDSNLMNHSECSQLAQNMYNIYTNEGKSGKRTKFVKLRVKNHGWLQPGFTIDFFYEDENVRIDRDNYYVMAVEPFDIRNNIHEIWLVNNIITLKEFTTVQKNINRDEDLVGTYYNANQVSIADATPVRQRSVGDLRASSPIIHRKTTTPTVNDDSDNGYYLGDQWFDTTGSSETAWVCVKDSPGAAIWRRMDN